MKYPIGGKLRQIRERKGTTLKNVAEKAGISGSLLSQIETNKVSPSLETLLTITEVLGIDLEYLFRQYRQEHRISVFDGAERNRRVQGGVFYEEVCPVLSADGESDFEVICFEFRPEQKRAATSTAISEASKESCWMVKLLFIMEAKKSC